MLFVLNIVLLETALVDRPGHARFRLYANYQTTRSAAWHTSATSRIVVWCSNEELTKAVHATSHADWARDNVIQTLMHRIADLVFLICHDRPYAHSVLSEKPIIILLVMEMYVWLQIWHLSSHVAMWIPVISSH